MLSSWKNIDSLVRGLLAISVYWQRIILTVLIDVRRYAQCWQHHFLAEMLVNLEGFRSFLK